MIECLQEKTVQCRKEHTCHGCERTINRGEKARYTVLKADDIYCLYTCQDCVEYITTVCKQCKGYHDCMADGWYEGFITDCKNERKDKNG